jgi:hypothetical protein
MRLTLSFTLAILMSSAPCASLQASELTDALTGGKYIFDMRIRFEGVDQVNLVEDSSALTTRARFGYETSGFYGVKLLAEAEGTWEMTPDVYNNSYDGQATYPVVADPGQLELNRAQISYTGIKDIGVIVGRQRIILDNARFIGNAGFRQNEQTFDAAQLTYTGITKAKFTYIYIDDVRRIFGRKSPVGTFHSNSHIIHGNYQLFKPVKLTGYAYLLDLQNKANAAGVKTPTTVSSQTYGGRVEGSYPIAPVTLSYAGEFAKQKNYANNPRVFDLNYYMVEGGAAAKGFSLTGGYEVLEGNGTQGFSTPLATLFAFNGWADVFLNTPGAGLKNIYVKAGYMREKVPVVGTVRAQVHYHDFKPQLGTAKYGNEWNALLSASPNKHLTFEARYATYDGKGGPFPNRNKIWFSVQYIK